MHTNNKQKNKVRLSTEILMIRRRQLPVGHNILGRENMLDKNKIEKIYKDTFTRR